jgi:hypothetical protein
VEKQQKIKGMSKPTKRFAFTLAGVAVITGATFFGKSEHLFEGNEIVYGSLLVCTVGVLLAIRTWLTAAQFGNGNGEKNPTHAG